MTKRETQKVILEKVIGLLEKDFGAKNFDDEGRGVLDFEVEDLMFQISRRNFEILGFDSIPLVGGGFPEAMTEKNLQSVRLENQMQSAIEDFFNPFS